MGLHLVTADGLPAPLDAVTAVPAGGPAARPRATVPVDAPLDSDSPRIDGEDGEHVRMLAAVRSPLPPILVHRETMRVIDGMHRLKAARLRGDDTIDVEFFDGGEVEAFALGVWLNIAHGLPLSQADRTAAAQRMLRARPHWSDRRIAAGVGLSAGTVAAVRRRSTGQNGQSNTRVGRDGRIRPLEATEGRLRASRVIAANPGASLREIAEQAGIAPATAKDVRDRIRRGQDPLPSRGRSAQSEPAAPGAAARPARGRTPARLSADAVGLLLPRLRKDPSLRTEAGRTLLHMLSVHSIGDEATWLRLARSVPGHRADVLAQAARRCADHWLRFADALETRGM
ncbi:ParB and winged helix-turn-helix domain-containing protein [Streptomyces sp. NPDC003456]|uniref:ParB and winged helix-turn-helix domain-containing protein n=1 Tax=Streptomyces sp. NPDC003456 TaxID=3364683 RepID=UPI0036BCE340